MTWLKLPNVGESVVVTIKNVGETETTDSLCFATTDGDLLYLPKAVALARLRDCGFTGPNGVTVDYDSIIGAQLVFAKIAPEVPGGRPRWMIERTRAAMPNTVPRELNPNGAVKMEVAQDATAARDAKRAAIRLVYEETLVDALAIQRRVHKLKKIDPAVVQAGAATLLIQYERNRCF